MLCSCVCSESADTRCVSRANENQSVATDIFTASAGRRTEWRRLERCSYGSPDRRTPPVSDQQIIVLYCIVLYCIVLYCIVYSVPTGPKTQ